MLSKKNVLAAIGVVGACGASSLAQVHIGDPIILENGPQYVSIHYYSATTPLDGMLSLDGVSTTNGLDMALFMNHDGALGFEHYLGVYEQGARIDFVYDVFTEVPDTFRTVNPVDAMQFRWEWSTPDIILVGIEDMRLPMGDGDYDDIMFEVRFQPIPAPGAGAAALALIGVAGYRRRRSS